MRVRNLVLPVVLGVTLAAFSAATLVPAAAADSGDVQLAQAEKKAKKKKKRDPGKRAYMRNTCIACHGRNGAAAILDYPNLAGQDEKYLVAQTKQIMQGKRSASKDATTGHPRTEGMRGALVTPEGKLRLDDKTIKAIAKWLSKKKPAPLQEAKAPADPDGVKAMQKLFKKKCKTCHGKEGKKPKKGYPYVAGQKRAYLVATLKDMRDKVRTNGKSKMMYPTIKKFSDADIENMADYLSRIDRSAK